MSELPGEDFPHIAGSETGFRSPPEVDFTTESGDTTAGQSIEDADPEITADDNREHEQVPRPNNGAPHSEQAPDEDREVAPVTDNGDMPPPHSSR